MVNWANRVTLLRILAIPLFIVVLYLPIKYKGVIAAIVFCIIAATDAVDGWLARKQHQVTKAGTVLDPLADKLLVAAALIFLIGKGVDAWMAYAIIAREFLVTGHPSMMRKSSSYIFGAETLTPMLTGMCFRFLPLRFTFGN